MNSISSTQSRRVISADDKFRPDTQVLHALWRSPDCSYQIATLNKKPNSQFRNQPVNLTAGIGELALRLSASGHDVYFACAGYWTSASRKAENAALAFAFWMDIDCGENKASEGKGYRTVEEALQAVQKFCQTAGLPLPTHIVHSGGGLHVYWALDASLGKAAWQKYAKKLKVIAEELGFLADPTRTADMASVMRFPGTLNYKYDPPRPVHLAYAADTYINTESMLAAIDAAHTQNSKACLRQKLVGDRYEPEETPTPKLMAMLLALLEYLDPDLGYDDWLRTGIVIFNETKGCDEGLALWDGWSSRGAKYKGFDETSKKWASFDLDHTHPLRLGTLIHIVKEAGHDAQAILAEAEPQFSVVADEGGEQ
jgi:hypothetical protein